MISLSFYLFSTLVFFLHLACHSLLISLSLLNDNDHSFSRSKRCVCDVFVCCDWVVSVVVCCRCFMCAVEHRSERRHQKEHVCAFRWYVHSHDDLHRGQTEHNEVPVLETVSRRAQKGVPKQSVGHAQEHPATAKQVDGQFYGLVKFSQAELSSVAANVLAPGTL